MCSGPKLGADSFFQKNVLERYQRVNRALTAAVAEVHATGANARKVQRVAAKMGIELLSKGRMGAITESLDADATSPDSTPPYIWPETACVKRCREGASPPRLSAATGRVGASPVHVGRGCRFL